MVNDRPPPQPVLALLIGIVAKRTNQAIDDVLAPHGLSRTAFSALGHVGHVPEVSVSELARRAGVTPQSMHATVTDLEVQRSLTRTAAGRGRRAGLSISEEGRHRLRAAMDDVAALDEEIRGRIGTESWEAMTSGLMRLLDDGGPLGRQS